MNGFRFITKNVTITHANDVVNFSIKMDKSSVICTGVMATVVTRDALHSTKRICDAAIVFAEGKNPVHIPVTNKPIDEHKKYGLLEIEQPFKRNVNVDGYVNDFGEISAYPYTVQIAFRVVDNIKK